MRRNQSPEHRPQTLVDGLRANAEFRSNKVVYTFLSDGEKETDQLTFSELDQRARQIAGRLQELNLAGERALLLFQPNLDYLAAFFGCLYAGVIAVPAYPPRNNRNLPRLKAIVDDAQAKVAITSTELLAKIQRMFADVEGLRHIAFETTNVDLSGYEEKWQEPHIDSNYIAFLQYTSGSTGDPKGVMLSHGNLLHNLAIIQDGFNVDENSTAVMWLPPYHDMGLIGGLLEASIIGAHIYYMPPAAFLQRPVRMLEALSKYKAQISGGPNFTYDLLVNKTTPEQREGLDLSHWNVAFNGAEPIHWGTLENFAEAFQPYGFKRETLYPCYGLAEATLFVSGSEVNREPVVGFFDKKALEKNQIVEKKNEKDAHTLVSSGHFFGDQIVKIVDPETCLAVAEGELGEVWVKGPCVAQGYWNRPEETAKTFQAYLADTNEGPFLRTEDLGFIKNGELFITGRIKDLIIIRGVNHYPQDIERTVESCHPSLRLGGGAAFSVEHNDEEKLVIVHEVEFRQKPDINEVAAAMQQAVAEHHDLQLYALMLVKPGRIPKTSSGKIKRRATKKGFLNNTLEALGVWQADDQSSQTAETEKHAEDQQLQQPATKKQNQIEQWLVEKIAAEMNIPAEKIDIDQPFARYGLDSVRATGLAGDLEEWLGTALPATLAYDYPTISALAAYLAEGQKDEKVVHKKASADEAIAIIGMGVRMPESPNLRSFWQLLKNGVDAISEVTKDRWDVDELYDPSGETPGKVVTKSGGFIKDVDKFDAPFFGISPREAKRMDPQQRLVLEVSWEALEDAGLAPSTLAGTHTGVFVGVSNNDYTKLFGDDPTNLDTYTNTGNAFSIVANRLSYFYDFRGPSIAIDTACSSSLVALHQAVNSLRRGETDLALAGGVNLILSPEITITFSHAGLLAPDGRCKTFDAKADGYSRGEGCGFVTLKRLSDAQRDGDRIYAVIRGTAVNQDGRSNGLTAPNSLAQQQVIRAALADADLKPEDIDYIEAHGTGTILGDPIEVKSIAKVMENRPKDKPCYIGSVKTNIGHLESAAGIAGVIKTALALYHEQIPKHLHFESINPHIPIEDMPLKIATEPVAWTRGERIRRAGVSSFGFGGTNSHVILEEALPVKNQSGEERPERPMHVLTLSAKEPHVLVEHARQMAGFLIKSQDAIGDVCYTANACRDHFPYRLAVRATSINEAAQSLQQLADGEIPAKGVIGTGTFRPGKIAFLFTGQGAQYVNMGKLLYETQPLFRKSLDTINELSKTHLDMPILSILFDPENDGLIDNTAYTQPALFAIEYALAQLWQSWGIYPDYVMGHSIGEFVAACISGVFSVEDGLKLVSARGRLMASLPEDGAMMAVFASLDTVKSFLEGHEKVDIAGINGPENVVVSGSTQAIDELEKKFEQAEIQLRRLTVSHAFHSAKMEPILDDFERIAKQVTYKAPRIPIVSNVSGEVMSDAIPDAAYWREHIRNAVLFADGITALKEAGCNVFIEPGPNPHMIGMGRRCLTDYDAVWIGSLKAGVDDWDYLLENISRLYVNGVTVNWRQFDKPYAYSKVELPTYPFQKIRYWLERRSGGYGGKTIHPLLGHQVPSPPEIVQYQNKINGNLQPYFHRLKKFRMPVMTPSAFVEMAFSAGKRIMKDAAVALEDVKFYKDLALDDSEEGTEVQVVVMPQSENEATFKAYSHQPDNEEQEWILHAEGNIVRGDVDSYARPAISLAELKSKCSPMSTKALIEKLEHSGLCLDDAADVFEETFLSKDFALTKLNVPADVQQHLHEYELHPLFLDVCCQAIGILINESNSTFIPDGFEKQIAYRKEFKDVWCYAVITSSDDDTITGDVSLVGEDGEIYYAVKGIRLKRMSSEEKAFYEALAYELADQPDTVVKQGSKVLNKAALLQAPEDERELMLAEHMKEQLARVLGMTANQINIETSINSFGLDSIMAVELQRKIEKTFDIKLPVARLIVGPTLRELSQTVLQLLAEHEDDSLRVRRLDGPEHGNFPLSHNQKAMWVQHSMAPKSIFNPSYAVRVRAKVDVEALNYAVLMAVNRHPALRTTFHSKNNNVVQKVHDFLDISLKTIDVSHLSDEEIQEKLELTANEVYDLARGPLFRVILFQKAEDDSILLISAHHIIVDMWSLAIIINDISHIYQEGADGRGLLPVELRYTDFVAWQENMVNGPLGKKHLEYWTNKLSGTLPILEMPSDFARPPVQTFNGKNISIKLGDELTEKLRRFSDEHGYTLYMTLLAAFNILLHKYTGQDDIIIGTATTGRSRSEFADIVGYFVNSVALRNLINPEHSFEDFVSQVKQTVVEALEHQDMPFYDVVEKVSPKRDMSRTPIFQVMFVYQQAQLLNDEGLSSIALGIEGETMEFAGMPLETVSIEEQVAPFDVTLMMAESSQGLGATLTYNTDLFTNETAKRMLSHFETLLKNIVEQPSQTVTELQVMSYPERYQQLFLWNSTEVPLPENLTIQDMFDEQVKKNPDAIAVDFEGAQLSYRELDEKSNQLAHYLKAKGVGLEKAVGLCINRSLEMIISLLGILKAGGAYLPLDPEYPKDRLSFMIAHSRVRQVLSVSTLSQNLPNFDGEYIYLDHEWQKIEDQSCEPLSYDAEPDNLAYIIYTSGSTGKPKGVMLTQKGLCNLVRAQIKAFHVRPDSRVLQYASFSFDASVSEIFMALASGATLYLISRETMMSQSGLLNALKINDITTITLPPSILALLPEKELPRLETIISAGEACTKNIVSKWSKAHRFINAYGPTESTVCTTCNPVDEAPESDNVPIGGPIDNIKVYIVDSQMNPVPIGVPGELLIGGVGLARGYFDRPDLTAQKFIPNPWSDSPGGRLYRSGDLVRYRHDGKIEFISRIDLQVKIRGLRVELGEIEALLEEHENIESAVVLALRVKGGEHQLAAYYISKDGRDIPSAELTRMLRAQLPSYMVPTSFLRMDAFPLTQNKKIDRNSFPNPFLQHAAERKDIVKPKNNIERTVAEAWQKVLNLKQVSVHDNFFEVGGHSLVMIQLHALLEERLNTKLNVVELLQYPTIASQAKYLANAKKENIGIKEAAQRATRQRNRLMEQKNRRRGAISEQGGSSKRRRTGRQQ